MIYLLEGLIFTILASDSSGIQGHWAREIQLPLASVAADIWRVVPLLFVLVALPPIRKRLGSWQHAVHALAIGCVLFPMLVFHAQTRQIPLQDLPDAKTVKAIRERFNSQVCFVSSGGGATAYLSQALNRDEVAKALFELDPNLHPSQPEQDGTGPTVTPP